MTKTQLKRLRNTLSIQSSSGKEDMMIQYITDTVSKLVPQATIEVIDNNVYVTKGQADIYPCVVSHTDTVHDIMFDYRVYQQDDTLFAFSSDTNKQTGIGGDDKVGVWICLEMLIRKDNIKCAFFHSEEIGCIGSSAADMSFFDNVGYVFQSDRKGYKDFVTSIYQQTLSSDSFQDKIKDTVTGRGYDYTSGGLTDVYQLQNNGLNVCVANMSSGYYSPHTSEETVSIKDSNNCMLLISELIDLLGCNRYEHTPETTYDSYGYGYGSYGRFWNDHETWYPKKKKKKKSKSSLTSRVTYKETYDNRGFAYINGVKVSDNDKYDEQNFVDDNLLSHQGECSYCSSKVYSYDDNQDLYCIGCDMMLHHSQVIKS